jgi:hypothetical protein
MCILNSSGFSGLVVSMLASGTQDRGFTPGQSCRFQMKKFSTCRKAIFPMSQIFGMLKNPVITWKLGHRQNQSAISRPIVPPFATRSARVDGDVGASGGDSENV